MPFLRLAVRWPLMIGLAILEKLSSGNQWLDVNTVIKVERRRVYVILLGSLPRVASNGALRDWITAARARICFG